jgi:hypothetical protein
MTVIGSRLLACSLAWLVFGLTAAAAEPIRADQLPKLQALIKPDKGEDKWSQIPWHVSLWQARQKAAELGKPILLWEMDGHPLGCT